MKYLVTGGCGFIGSHLVDALSADGHGIRILDNLSTGTLTYKPPGVEFIHGDITEREVVADAMDCMDGCFHLAAVASVERGNLDWVGSHRTNITGTVTIFDTARRADPPIPVVYASSAAVYGENPDTLSEDAKPRPVSAYGADKFGCELHGFVASRVHGVPIAAFGSLMFTARGKIPGHPIRASSRSFPIGSRRAGTSPLMVMATIPAISSTWGMW